MFWADKLLEGRTGKEIINDSWTPSGIVHMGSLKGPVIHDVLFKILKEQKRDVTFMYGFDDADPIDGLPPDLEASHSKYLGIPLHKAPAPDGNGSFGEYFGNKMKALLGELGVTPEIYKTSELYQKGTFNKAITFLLDHAKGVRKVYGDVYQKTIADDWFPLQVVCPKCGKLSTTKVTAWDGKEVTFSCEENLVKWAKGCFATGKISPFDGNAKLPWKVEWAAKWYTFGVTIEGAGKDHASAGGSYDVARKIYNEVFEKEPPLSFAYEFFLSGGKKMSSSKGLGLTGEELLEVLPPELARFLMIKTPPNQAVEFNPRDTDAIPKVYDDYQGARLDRVFALSQVGNVKEPPLRRFYDLIQLIQMPNKQGEIKKQGLEEWVPYAKKYIEKYAPESLTFAVQEEIPASAKNLSEKQKEFLKKVAQEIANDWDPEELQTKLYEWAKEIGISSGDAFAAIYTSLIGKNHGPKAAWFILDNKEFVKKRFAEV